MLWRDCMQVSPEVWYSAAVLWLVCRIHGSFVVWQDIKALFPSDYNPFYAGFGNRDTDELSYKKMGIPKGKIFIINPKVSLSHNVVNISIVFNYVYKPLKSRPMGSQGEVAVNSSVDVKSYTSLHTLVNDMFPPTTLVEQVSLIHICWIEWYFACLRHGLELCPNGTIASVRSNGF